MLFNIYLNIYLNNFPTIPIYICNDLTGVIYLPICMANSYSNLLRNTAN